jgi:hypothetical protein
VARKFFARPIVGRQFSHAVGWLKA